MGRDPIMHLSGQILSAGAGIYTLRIDAETGIAKISLRRLRTTQAVWH